MEKEMMGTFWEGWHGQGGEKHREQNGSLRGDELRHNYDFLTEKTYTTER